ncbi:MAG: DUF5721 family protein [Butyrivibrio sp.]|jgi:hypothetical protein|nr:DUF5721 family protein [Butyrivibrio sp.]
MTELKITHTKDFMNKLLNGSCFDDFLLEEATIQTYNTFSIDGHICPEFYEGDDATRSPYALSLWRQMKPVCLNLIRGKHTPISFRFVLHCNPEIPGRLLQDANVNIDLQQIAAFVLNVRFQNGSITLTTGTSIRTFIPDKSYEQVWDHYLHSFLSENEIAFEDL